MIPNVIIPDIPDFSVRAALSDLLFAYNESKTGPSGLTPLAILLQEPGKGRLIGGLWGRSVYDWLFVELLFVPEQLRGQGLGKTLLQKAETIAVERGCIGVCLDSFDFQAPGFYLRFGYEIFAELESPKRTFKRHLLRKFLI